MLTLVVVTSLMSCLPKCMTPTKLQKRLVILVVFGAVSLGSAFTVWHTAAAQPSVTPILPAAPDPGTDAAPQ